MRAKWSAPIRKYWKISEQMMVKYCDLAICDSVNIEKYIHECYDGKGIKGRNPKTTFIAYGADLTLSKLADDDEKLMNWYREKGLTKKDYYLVVGRFVPENSFEVMIREFMKSKSKKNFAIITNVNRTQYRQKNHHEAIVSREVFNAANHLRASRNYSKKNRPLPVLSVVEDGILRGYVPFDKDWTGFSAEEYREASESVMKEPDVTVTADVKKRLDLTGYEIVRVQYFSTMQNPAMTISNGRLRFNTACLKKFENVEYVELLLNSVERCIAIRPCDKNNPNAIRWGRLKEGRWCASTLGCRGLAKTLFDIMEWDEDLRYRFRGQFLEQGDNKMMLFAFDEPEMIKVEEIVLPPKENTEEDEGETVKKKIYIFPPEWAGTFGQPITSIAQVGILRQEHYAGNWDVFRPATEIEEMNIFTAESLNELLREAEKIMEGWTDYR